MGELNIFPNNSCLLSELETKLLNHLDKDLSQILIILPTQRLATRFLASLAKKLIAFYPPKILTMESFISSSFSSGRGLISDQALDLIFQRMIQSQELLKFVRPGHERELRLIFNEMTEVDIRNSAFSEARKSLEENIYHSDLHLSSIGLRISEIEGLFVQMQDFFDQHQLETRQQRMARAAQENGIGRIQLLDSFESCYWVGITSVANSWQPVINEFLKVNHCHLWLSDIPPVYSRNSPLETLTHQLVAPKNYVPIDKLKSNEKSSTLAISSDNSFHEVITAAQIAKYYIESGLNPADIGILQTNESIYGPILNSLRKTLFKDANFAMTTALNQSNFGRWLEKYLNTYHDSRLLAKFDWLSDQISSQWLMTNFEADVTHLSWRAMKGKYLEFNEFLSGESIDEDFALQLKKQLEFFPNTELNLETWLETFEEFISQFPWTDFIEEQYKESLISTLKEFRTNLHQVVLFKHAQFSRSEFIQLLSDQLLSAGLRQVGEPLSGIQILSLSESRYYPFKVVLILGCNEGVFPKSLPKDELLDNFMKKQMGFPGWEQLEAMEDQTFHLLQQRIPQLIMLRCRQYSGQIAVTSRFIDHLRAKSSLRELDSDFAIQQLWKELDPLYEADDEESETEGQIPIDQNLWSTMSASSLQKLISCPYSFLLNKSGIRDLDFMEEDDKRTEGEWLHKVLQQLFLISPPTDDPLSFQSWIINQLIRLTVEFGPKGITERPLYYQLIHHSWPAFARHLGNFFGENLSFFGQGHKEASLEKLNSSGAKVLVRDLPRKLNGAIDSIDFNFGFSLLTDYKRKRIPTRSETVNGLNPQLAFYAIALNGLDPQLQTDRLLLGYWSILQGEWQTHGVGDQVIDKSIKMGLANPKSISNQELIDKIFRNWHWREESIMDKNRYYADPSQCGLCNYGPICRKNAPRSLIQEQNFLNGFIKDGAR